MAEAIALVKIAPMLLGKIGDYIFAPIGRQFTYMFCFNSNIKELEAKLKELETTRQGVQLGVDDDLSNVRVIGPNVEAWLTSANEVTSEVEEIIQVKPKVKEGCLYGWCPNLKLRYALSRKAVKKTKVVVDLQAAGIQYTKLSYSPPPASMETIPNRDFTGFKSRRHNMEEIIEALTDDETNLIGICGLAGVGKTKMVQEVGKRAKEENLFDEVAFIGVGQYPDLAKVQKSIADIFGLADLGKHDDVTTRARLLRKRLSKGRKILLILDNIWSEFDMEEQGIPLGGSNKTFKILYTSRLQGVWHDVPNKKEIALELLLEEEAWQLFKEKAGELVDAPEVKPIAKQIMNKCGHLPLALVIIGSTLSKKSRGRFIKDIWEDMLDRLTCPTSTPADRHLSSSLELSYHYIEDEDAKHLFLLCCLFEEDKSIRVEDLARYALGLSLFDGINGMEKARHRVFTLVDDLKSRYLLLDGKCDHGDDDYEHVKVHDVVRGMGISIASKAEGALVSHGALSEWPKKDTYEHYTSISVISGEITELPEGLTCQNLEFLMLHCSKLEKLPCNFFDWMEKLKVFELNNFYGILTVQSLRNLTTLSLEGFGGMLDRVSVVGDLLKLEILSFRSSSIEELPEEIGELVNLRLLDLSKTFNLHRIRPGVISRLVHLEELYIGQTRFWDWEGEREEEGQRRNANLREFESLSSLHTLEIMIRNYLIFPSVPIFSKLKIYKIQICRSYSVGYASLFPQYQRQLEVSATTPIPSDRGGIDSLLRSSDCLILRGEGCYDLVRELLLRDGVDGLQQLKKLLIDHCVMTPPCLTNTMNLVQRQPNAAAAASTACFPILQVLNLSWMPNLIEICHGPVPAGSFRQLTEIRVQNCGLGYLFQLAVVGCLTKLKHLTIRSCAMMGEVIWKVQREDVHIATNNKIEFRNLEHLNLWKLPSLMGFCRGIDQIDFPQLKTMEIKHLGQVNCLFHNNSNLSSTSEQRDDVCFLSLFPQKVTFPTLENLVLEELQNVSDLLRSELPRFSLSKLKKLELRDCGISRNMLKPSMAGVLVNLQKLIIRSSSKIESVVDREEEIENEQGREVEKTLFPQLRLLELSQLPNLKRFCHFTHPIEMSLLSNIRISSCPSMDTFSLGHVSAPNLSLPDILWNGDLNNAVQPLQKKIEAKKSEERRKGPESGSG